jgi:hypothetical protein
MIADEGQGPAAGKSGWKVHTAVEIAVAVIAVGAMLYAVCVDGERKPFSRPKTAPARDCTALFNSIRSGNVVGDTAGCEAQFSNLIASITSSYVINGAALRAGTKTVSLYGATIERLNRNPGGQLGNAAIPTIRIGHGQPAADLNLEFGSDKQADEAFLSISNTLAKLK